MNQPQTRYGLLTRLAKHPRQPQQQPREQEPRYARSSAGSVQVHPDISASGSRTPTHEPVEAGDRSKRPHPRGAISQSPEGCEGDAKTTFHTPHCVLKVARTAHVCIDDLPRPILRLLYRRRRTHLLTPQTEFAHCNAPPCFTRNMEDERETFEHAGLAAWRCLKEANKRRHEYRAEKLNGKDGNGATSITAEPPREQASTDQRQERAPMSRAENSRR